MKTIMKHIRMLALMLLVGIGTTAFAQTQRWFESLDIVECQKEGLKQKVATCVAGEKVRKYNLDLFRSVEGTATPKAFDYIEKCLRADEKVAVDKEIRRENGKTKFALLRFKCPFNNSPKYACYIIYQSKGKNGFTCVYLEGNASVKQLKEMFSK